MSCILNKDVVVCFGAFGNCAACVNWENDMATVKIEFNERESAMIKEALKVKVASITRSYKAASDVELKNVFSRQIQEHTDLARKFP